MPYCILCKMQRVTSPRYRNFLHCRENFCPTDEACATDSRRIDAIAIRVSEQDSPAIRRNLFVNYMVALSSMRLLNPHED